jgi:hypothetical protein
VVRPGQSMPLRADGAPAALRADGAASFPFTGLDLARQVPTPLEIELPGGLRKPFWIRCFATGPANVALIDPPVTELKVS